LSVAKLSGLVGDVGGTHARFAIAETHGRRTRIRHAAVLNAADYPTGEAALEAYLKRLKGKRPHLAVIAAAGPVHKGKVSFTNNEGWGFSERRMAKKCGFAEVRLINDFTAQALAIDRLGPGDTRRIGPDVRGRAEGGHSAFAPEDEVEIEILRRLTARFGEVSIERVVSGPGLFNLYQALADMAGKPASLTAPDQVTHAGLAGPGLARDALGRFCAILGSVAGNLALAMGAQGGVYISGGIAPDIFDFLAASDFRRRFETKDRMGDYLRAIPTRVVVQPHAALIGAAALLGDLK